MTKRRLRFNVLLVIAAFAVLLVIALSFKHSSRYGDVYDTTKDFSSFFVATAAAYLAYCFQRRQAFLVSLRDLWKEMIEAKSELIDYTHIEDPDHAAFGKAHRALSRCIDMVRGVYRNVGETTADIGLFPFEPLHDMRRTLDALGWEDNGQERRRAAREQIVRSWNALRCNFLREFSTPEPQDPITDRNAVDPRRHLAPASHPLPPVDPPATQR